MVVITWIVDDSMKFCNLLAQMIKEANLSNVKFYTALGIKKPYFYDILSGKVNPPPPDRQFAMLRLLKSNSLSKERCFLTWLHKSEMKCLLISLKLLDK